MGWSPGWVASTLWGIGQAGAERLVQAGITSGAALAQAVTTNAAALSAGTGIRVQILQSAVYLAERLPSDLAATRLELAREISGIGSKTAAVLYAVGLRTLAQLRAMNPGTFDLSRLPGVTSAALADFCALAHLKVLCGLSRADARRLLDAGVRSLAGLAGLAAPPAGVSPALFAQWRRIAAALPAGFVPESLETVQRIIGIGPKYGTALAAAGVATLDQIRTASSTTIDLTWVPGFEPSKFTGWVRMAELQLIDGVGPAYSRLLLDAGFATFGSLLDHSPSFIHESLLNSAQSLSLDIHLPSLEDVAGWTRQAFGRRLESLRATVEAGAGQARRTLTAAAAGGGAMAAAMAGAEQRAREASEAIRATMGDVLDSLPKPEIIRLVEELSRAVSGFADWVTLPERLFQATGDLLSLSTEARALETDVSAFARGLLDQAAAAGERALTSEEQAQASSLRDRARTIGRRFAVAVATLGALPDLAVPGAVSGLLDTLGQALDLIGLDRAVSAFAALAGQALTVQERQQAAALGASGVAGALRRLGAGLLPAFRGLARDKVALYGIMDTELTLLLTPARNPGFYTRTDSLGRLFGATRSNQAGCMAVCGGLNPLQLLVLAGLICLGVCLAAGNAACVTTEAVSVGTASPVAVPLIVILTACLLIVMIYIRYGWDQRSRTSSEASGYGDAFPAELTVPDLEALNLLAVEYGAGLENAEEFGYGTGQLGDRTIAVSVYEGRNTHSPRQCTANGSFTITAAEFLGEAMAVASMKWAVSNRILGWRNFRERWQQAVMGEAMASLMFKKRYSGYVWINSHVSGYPDFRVNLPARALEYLEAKGTYFDYYVHVYRALYDGHYRNLRNVGQGWVTCFPLAPLGSTPQAKIYAVYYDGGQGSRSGGQTDPAAALTVTMTAADLSARGDGFSAAENQGDAWYAYLLSGLVSMGQGDWPAAGEALAKAEVAAGLLSQGDTQQAAPHRIPGATVLREACQALASTTPAAANCEALADLDALGDIQPHSGADEVGLLRDILTKVEATLEAAHQALPAHLAGLRREAASSVASPDAVSQAASAPPSAATLVASAEDGYAVGYHFGVFDEATLAAGELVQAERRYGGVHYVLEHGGVRVCLSTGKLRVGEAETSGGMFALSKASEAPACRLTQAEMDATVAWVKTLLR